MNIPQPHRHPLPKVGRASPATQFQTEAISTEVPAGLMARQDPWQLTGICVQSHIPRDVIQNQIDFWTGWERAVGHQPAQPLPSSQGRNLLPSPCFPIILALPGCALTLCATTPLSPTKAGATQPSPQLLCSHQKDSGWETRSRSSQREGSFEGYNGRLKSGYHTAGTHRSGQTCQPPWAALQTGCLPFSFYHPCFGGLISCCDVK